ncbi:restriction endonuclease [Bifidobacterium sp. ESL0704]|uniref:restriction endonuclease n=1 Tax=Bifidobacterium sp. ESL0704 TaxID=2983219 RepID=UPI0023F8DD34|nr:restriction endonuclease [Bifidobacterium sp. ESL0704]WEV52534.1 restriction endonuclease [Bifidobacterium sp. ESL0704]
MTDFDVSDKLIKLIPVLEAHIIPLVITAAGIIMVVLVLRELRQIWLKGKVRKTCDVEVPKGVRISHSRDDDGIGSFVLNYPYWQFSKKDGTADRRHSNNKICKPKSTLEVAGFSFKSKNPLTLYGLVLDMRHHGNSISYSREESFKRQRAVQRVKVRQRATSVQAIVDSFSSQPADFEPFCADLYRNFGYQVAVTQSNNDGGFDLKMIKDGRTYIAECKCFEPYRHVGLPFLRKLAGANEIQHAQGLIFITTSTYTAQAVKYANEADIQLIDGSTLVQMCQQAWGKSSSQGFVNSAIFELAESDLLSQIPVDMRYRFE